MKTDSSPRSPLPRRRSRLREMLSPQKLKSELLRAASLFPVTVVFVLLITLYIIAEIWDVVHLESACETALVIALPLGALLSLAAYQWGRFCGVSSKMILLQTACVLLVVADFLWLALRGHSLTVAEGIGYAAAFTALAVAVFFLPPRRRTSVRLHRYYTLSVLRALALAVVVEFVMSAAVLVFITTLQMLFNVGFGKTMPTAMVLFSFLLPVLVFLCHVPVTSDLREHDSDFGLALAALCKNVLLPLALVYSAILYCYGFKILLTLDLPKGTVTWMVTGLVVVSFVILYGLQGYLCDLRSKESHKSMAALALHWLPALLFPLLVLMSVAIFYRIAQYGITPSRLYVATFNIWAYAVVIYLFFARLPRLNMVAGSFAVVFLLTSVIPGLNYCTIGIRAVQKNLFKELEAAGATHFPLDYEELKALVATLPEDKAESIASGLAFLDDWDEHGNVEALVKCDHTIYKWALMGHYDERSAGRRSIDIVLEELSPMPQGYSSVRYVTLSDYSDNRLADGAFTLTDDSISVVLPADSLSRLSDAAFRPVKLEVTSAPGDIYMLTGVRLSVDTARQTCDNIYLRGYYFKQ